MRWRLDLLAILLIGAIALLLRLAFLYRAPVFLTGDSQSHFLPGWDLINGLSFEPELRRPAGYPLFVAGVIATLGEDLRAVAFAQHLLGVAAAVLTYFLGRLTFGRLAGLVGGLLVAVNGALILSEHSIMTEALFGALLVGFLVTLLLGAGRLVAGETDTSPGPNGRTLGSAPWLVVAGIVLGLATLTRPVAQILVPLVPIWLLVVQRRWKPALYGSIVAGIGFLIVVGPWMVRNLAEHGSLTASGGLGRSLVARTIKYDVGYFDRDVLPSGPDDFKGEVRQFIRGKRNTIRNSRSVRSTQAGLMKEFGLTQAESDRLMRQVALEAIAERPGYYVTGSLQMAGQILTGKEKEDALLTRWNQRTDKDWVEQWEARIDHLVAPTSPAELNEMAQAEWIVNIYQPSSVGWLVPMLALVGILFSLTRPSRRSALLVGAAAAALVLASAALDGPVPRYRYPIDPLIGLLAAGGVVAAIRLVAARITRWTGQVQRSRMGGAPVSRSYAGPPSTVNR